VVGRQVARKINMSYTAADIKALREETGAGMMDCKRALEESNGDMEKAREWVRQRGLAKAEKTADRETKEGYIASYVHSTNKIAALVEILCETDFVARNSEFQEMARNVAMQVASMNPATVEELLAQDFIKNPDTTIEQMVKGLSGKIGERFVINRMVRFEVGEATQKAG
jgi:elongation factor Ts